MSNIQLHQIVKVSNNSRLTQQVLASVNEKLNDKEKRDFVEWLKIVERKS